MKGKYLQIPKNTHFIRTKCARRWWIAIAREGSLHTARVFFSTIPTCCTQPSHSTFCCFAQYWASARFISSHSINCAWTMCNFFFISSKLSLSLSPRTQLFPYSDLRKHCLFRFSLEILANFDFVKMNFVVSSDEELDKWILLYFFKILYWFSARLIMLKDATSKCSMDLWYLPDTERILSLPPIEQLTIMDDEVGGFKHNLLLEIKKL